MKKYVMIGLLTAGALGASAFEQQAAARSVAAYMGKARYGNQTGCFVSYSFFGPEIFGSVCDDAQFLIPLTIDNSGTKKLTFTASASTSGSACRVVANDRYGTALSTSPLRSIPVSDTLVSRTTEEVVVPSRGVFFADCRTDTFTKLGEFDYSP